MVSGGSSTIRRAPRVRCRVCLVVTVGHVLPKLLQPAYRCGAWPRVQLWVMKWILSPILKIRSTLPAGVGVALRTRRGRARVYISIAPLAVSVKTWVQVVQDSGSIPRGYVAGRLAEPGGSDAMVLSTSSQDRGYRSQRINYPSYRLRDAELGSMTASPTRLLR